MNKFLLAVLLLGMSSFVTCADLLSETPVTNDGVSIYYRTQPPYYGASPAEPVNLNNNEAARNPTWQELVSFLELDDTDKGAYGFGLQVCADFANELHDNAEKASIKAAWVAIEFEGDSEGHAFNAFETTDRGLIFVDCTGLVPTDTVPLTSVDTDGTAYKPPPSTHKDRIAYVEVGREYGLIYFEYALSPEYGFYEGYQKEYDNIDAWLEEYNQAVTELNQKVEMHNNKAKSYSIFVEEYKLKLGGRKVIEDPDEYAELSRIHNELEKMRLELELEKTELDKEGIQFIEEREDLKEERNRLGWYSIEPLGIVSSVEIYW